MYKEICITKNFKPVTFEKYRQIFQEYNLGFFKPKKDQCKRCLAQDHLTAEEKSLKEDEFKKPPQEKPVMKTKSLQKKIPKF